MASRLNFGNLFALFNPTSFIILLKFLGLGACGGFAVAGNFQKSLAINFTHCLAADERFTIVDLKSSSGLWLENSKTISGRQVFKTRYIDAKMLWIYGDITQTKRDSNAIEVSSGTRAMLRHWLEQTSTFTN